MLQGLTLPTLVRRLGVRASPDEEDDAEQDLIRRARDAGFKRLDELRELEGADSELIERACDNAERMWQSVGFAPPDAQSHDTRIDHAMTVNALKDEMLTVAREAVVQARSESGTDPTVVDRVLRRLDARGSLSRVAAKPASAAQTGG